jgi:hypothetical protein
MLFGCQEDESQLQKPKTATNLLKTKLTAFGKC